MMAPASVRNSHFFQTLVVTNYACYHRSPIGHRSRIAVVVTSTVGVYLCSVIIHEVNNRQEIRSLMPVPGLHMLPLSIPLLSFCLNWQLHVLSFKSFLLQLLRNNSSIHPANRTRIFCSAAKVPACRSSACISSCVLPCSVQLNCVATLQQEKARHETSHWQERAVSTEL